MMGAPLTITVAPHPYLAGRWTNLVSAGDASARGWMTLSALPLGTWQSKAAAVKAARHHTLRGVR